MFEPYAGATRHDSMGHRSRARLRTRVRDAGAVRWALRAAGMRPRLPRRPQPAQRTVLVMGDSLSAAYGLAASQGWVALTAEPHREGRSPAGAW